MKYVQSRGWGDWAWPSSVSLGEVTASIADVTSLSEAPIRQLYIRETSEFWLHARVRDALIATRPVYLNIRPETWYHGSGGLEALGTFLRASLGPKGRLRCLEVTVTCYTPLEAPLVWVVRPNALTRRGTCTDTRSPLSVGCSRLSAFPNCSASSSTTTSLTSPRAYRTH